MNRKFVWILGIFIFLYFIIGYIANFYIDYEWFNINKTLQVFWVLFLTKFNVQLIFSIIFIILFSLNFLLIRILGGKGRIFTTNILDRLKIPVLGSPRKALFIILVIFVIVIGFIMGGAASSYWKEYLLYKNSVPFAGFPKDPIFNIDIGFYVFSLPFYQFLYGWLMSSLFMITLFSVFFHMINRGIFASKGKLELSLFARAHISTLLASIVALYGIGYRIKAYELLYSKIGKFYGAGYTAINANLVAYNVAMVISLIAAALFLFNIFKRSFKLPLFVLAALLPVYFILGVIYPSVQQRFIVEPNEFDKEKKYIEYNIKYTRKAYDIDRAKEYKFKNKKNLSIRDIKKNKIVLENIRIWDWKPLKQTYKQLQELKPYYTFNDVDVDRYILNKKKIAVNLSARELSINKLSKKSQTWVNKHLFYTHGYGLTLSRVDKKTSEGQPVMLIYDIPPKSDINIEINRPEIYYGEHDNPYVITNTATEEFDYPFGDDNKFTKYKGTGGTKLNSLFKRLLFAAAFKDINILISRNMNKDSRLLYRRNIMEIVYNLTPFLDFDNDPYLVISEGKLYWIIDAYTSTNHFPYSTPKKIGRKMINYIRNPVKVIIDAYNGKVDYYLSDTKDPIIKTYSKIFPGFFKSMDKMPEDLKKHIRYPEGIFTIQAHMLLTYHMTNPNVFYNNEDAWHIPSQKYEGETVKVRSYYLVTKLPNEKNSEFILIMPFTPYRKDNMLAFMIAKCDMPNYGEINIYSLPKEKLSYGPMQIEARIDQNPEISKQLTLWGQKGSSVIRGNMLVIPIEESLLFIEPLYLKAESSEMPELKRVIVSFNDKIVMEKDLNTAISKIFFEGELFDDEPEVIGSFKQKIKQLSNKAFTHFTRAQGYMRSGKWSKYGEELKKLKDALTALKSIKVK
ncbi:UPF0182 family protein [Spirochaetota bacterium]